MSDTINTLQRECEAEIAKLIAEIESHHYAENYPHLVGRRNYDGLTPEEIQVVQELWVLEGCKNPNVCIFSSDSAEI